MMSDFSFRDDKWDIGYPYDESPCDDVECVRYSSHSGECVKVLATRS